MLKNACLKEHLAFDFQLENFGKRIVEIKVIKQNYDFKNQDLEIVFNTFMEDLLYFINQKRIQTKWDVEKIIVTNLKSLDFTKQEEKYFFNQIKNISNWKMEGFL